MKISNGLALIAFFIFITAYVHSDMDDTEAKTPEQEQIKAKSICIGEDCRSKWPTLKCADYEGRPAGETGDEFCAKMDKTCVAVAIGGGQSFFDECSAVPNSVHRCRCCWVE